MVKYILAEREKIRKIDKLELALLVEVESIIDFLDTIELN
jgi:hypothetical protein